MGATGRQLRVLRQLSLLTAYFFQCKASGGYTHRLIYSMLDAVPPIHAESSHVATDMDPSK